MFRSERMSDVDGEKEMKRLGRAKKIEKIDRATSTRASRVQGFVLRLSEAKRRHLMHDAQNLPYTKNTSESDDRILKNIH